MELGEKVFLFVSHVQTYDIITSCRYQRIQFSDQDLYETGKIARSNQFVEHFTKQTYGILPPKYILSHWSF